MTTQLNEYGYPIARFVRTDENAEGDSWCHVAYFDLDALLLVDCELNPLSPKYDGQDLAEQLTGWYRSYGGPGRPFLHSPFAKIQRKRNRVMVRQYGGLDI